MDKKTTDRLLYLLPLAAVVLTALPWCVKMRFLGENGYFIEYFSGFSLVPPGYALWSPMLTGICAAALTGLGFFHARSGQPRLLRWMTTLTLVAVLMGATSLAFGAMTVVSFLVLLALGAEMVLLYRLRMER